MGLLNPSDWKAQWIGVAPKANASKADPWFRKDFSISGKPVRAVVYVASLGYHDLYINGESADIALGPVDQRFLAARALRHLRRDRICSTTAGTPWCSGARRAGRASRSFMSRTSRW